MPSRYRLGEQPAKNLALIGARRCLIATPLLVGSLWGVFPGCQADVQLGENFVDSGAAGALVDGGAAGAPDTPDASSECEPAECQGRLYECGDCEDNDDDGFIDAQDAQCLGPCDRSEGSLPTDIPSQGGGSCLQDCFFDGDNGAGNDGCSWDHSCDPLSVAPGFPPSGRANCEYSADAVCDDLEQDQAPDCLEQCLSVTPNGCDCFGCCELPAGSGDFVFLGSEVAGGCELDALEDLERCPPCTPVPSCFNDCGPCELCIGRNEVAPDCEDPSERCQDGDAPCGAPGEERCSSSRYCVTGCCLEVVY